MADLGYYTKNIIRFLAVASLAVLGRIFFIHFAPHWGFPPIPVADMMGRIYGGGEMLGWMLIFGSGWMMATIYVLMFSYWVPLDNRILRGTFFGVIVFLLSMVNFSFFYIVGTTRSLIEGQMAMSIFGNLISCLIFGMILSWCTRE